MRPLLALGFALALVASGALAPVASAGDAAEVQSDGASACAAASPSDFADPAEDALGWENGHWYDEPIAVDRSDGLNDTELDAVVARTMARVEAVRCLEFTEPVPVTVLPREEFRAEESNRSVDETLRTFDNAKFEALFLVNESQDSIAVQRENRGSSVLGYYHPGNDEIVLVAEDSDAARVDELTLAHELVHALQDQQFDLGRFDARLRDDANAQSGLIEGDALYVERLYEDRCADAWNGSCLDRPSNQGGDLANIGIYFLEFQPYSDGPSFVEHVHGTDGWASVDAAYEAPPESAEQVIVPEKYGEDAPTNVSIDDPGGEWERVDPAGRPTHAELGQSAIVSMFVYPTYHSQGRTTIVHPDDWLNRTDSGEVSEFDPLHYDQPQANGWEGDRLHVYRNDDETAYVWRLAWESEDDATEFAAAYGRLLEYWGGERIDEHTYRIPPEADFSGSYRVLVDGDRVTVVRAPTTDALSTVYDADPNASDGIPDDASSDASDGDADAGPEDETPVAVPGFGVLAALATLGALAVLVALAAFAARGRR